MKMGADNLVSVASKMENEFLRKTMRGLHTDSAWLGLHRADEGTGVSRVKPIHGGKWEQIY